MWKNGIKHLGKSQLFLNAVCEVLDHHNIAIAYCFSNNKAFEMCQTNQIKWWTNKERKTMKTSAMLQWIKASAAFMEFGEVLDIPHSFVRAGSLGKAPNLYWHLRHEIPCGIHLVSFITPSPFVSVVGFVLSIRGEPEDTAIK